MDRWIDGIYIYSVGKPAVLSLTTKPITPMMRKPIPTAWEILMNSRLSATEERVENVFRQRP